MILIAHMVGVTGTQEKGRTDIGLEDNIKEDSLFQVCVGYLSLDKLKTRKVVRNNFNRTFLQERMPFIGRLSLHL